MNNDFVLGDVALFIDWENFKISLAGGNRVPNVSALKEEVSNHGRVVVAKAYADWVTRSPELKGASQFVNDPPALYASGIEPVYVPTRLQLGNSNNSNRTITVKNSVDVKMTADCIECAHSYPNIDTFVIVSGDSDFIHVINALRTMGKKVIIIGVSWTTSRRLSALVDGLIFYDIDVDQDSNNASNTYNAPPTRNNYSRQDVPDILQSIENIVIRERESGRIPLLTSVKQRLIRQYPGLDERRLGFTGFKKLVQAATEQGKIQMVTVGMADWVILADEPVPEEITSEETDISENIDNAIDANTEESNELKTSTDNSEKLAAYSGAMSELLSSLEKASSTRDDNDESRINQIIVMSDYLYDVKESTSITPNTLGDEISSNIKGALDANNEEIKILWEKTFSKTYVNKLIKGLSDEKVFTKSWGSVQEEGSDKPKRKRTLSLNREHPVVYYALESYWGQSMEDNASFASNEDEDSGSGLAGRVMRLFSR